MSKRSVIVAVVFALFGVVGMSTSVLAFTYSSNKALFFTYETDGAWSACGPNQCAPCDESTERAAKSDVRDKYRHGDGAFLGYYGKCRVYQGDGSLSGGDNSTDWVIAKLDKKCD